MKEEEKLKCTCGGEMVIDRSNPLRMWAGSIPFLKCLKCGRTGGYLDWGRNIFQVQQFPMPKDLLFGGDKSQLPTG